MLAAAVAGLVILVALTWRQPARLIPMLIYGLSLIALYGASSAYHWVRTSPSKLLILRKLDHVAIYLLIAGSYTPLLSYALNGAWRITMLAVVWGLAVFGMTSKLWLVKTPRWLSTVLYLFLGWIALVPLGKLVHNLPPGALWLLFAGGLAYTLGALIYATKILNLFPNRFGFHEIFHILTSIGSVSHFLMIALYLTS